MNREGLIGGEAGGARYATVATLLGHRVGIQRDPRALARSGARGVVQRP